MLDLCLLGTGGMMPLPYRWLTSLMLRYNGSSLLIDCGEGTQIAIREKGWSFRPLDIICITHFHGDHISGLPGILLAMSNSDRTEPLTMIGPKGLERVVKALRVIAPELPFEIKFIELTEPQQQIRLHGYVIDAFKVNHRVACYGYSISIERAGMFDVEKARQNEVPIPLWSKLQKGETIRGSDLFICEGMYGEKGDVNNAVKYKHMTFEEAGRLAKQAGVKELWLTHYSPALNRPEQYIEDVRQIFQNAYPGKDKKSLELNFEES